MVFSRLKALAYLDRYWNSKNPSYHYYDNNDCTNFISQCWYAAGIPMTLGWHGGKEYIENHPGTANTNSWVDTDAFFEYMTHDTRGGKTHCCCKME